MLLGNEEINEESERTSLKQTNSVKSATGGRDPRFGHKVCSYIVLGLGAIMGTVGLVYVVMQLVSGDAKADEV